jgi:predicted deacylase
MDIFREEWAMGVTIRNRDVVLGSRIEGDPWSVPVVEMTGAAGGPTTAFVAGVFGDKPLGCLALHELRRQLASSNLNGTVLLVPAANPPALAAGTRISPDLLYLNRRFPGQPTGALTDQIAYQLTEQVLKEADAVVDLHSGTPTMGLNYTYDYGDVEFSTAFGYLPVITGHAIEGQLSVAVTKNGGRSCLPEFGGGSNGDPTVGVEGCLNVLRYRGQLDGDLTGPRTLPLVDDIRFLAPSHTGILMSRYTSDDVGRAIEPGVIGSVVNVATGATIEEFVVEDRPALLLLARTTPLMVAPGDFAFMVGYPSGEVTVPGR